jgi:hypothetical protein
MAPLSWACTSRSPVGSAPNAYEVGATGSEWAAKLYLAQPVRQGAGGVWVITRTASPAGSY